MPRLIDADALMAQLNRKKAGPHDRKYTEGFNDALMRFRSMVHSAHTIPTDEVRGVVHCRECIYPTERKPEIICPVSCIGLKPYDYCSHGVRMTEVSEDA